MNLPTDSLTSDPIGGPMGVPENSTDMSGNMKRRVNFHGGRISVFSGYFPKYE